MPADHLISTTFYTIHIIPANLLARLLTLKDPKIDGPFYLMGVSSHYFNSLKILSAVTSTQASSYTIISITYHR